MRSNETLYYLETRTPAQIRPARFLPTDLTLVEQRDHDVVRDLTLAIGRPYDWPSQHWDDRRWTNHLRRDDLRHWTAERGGELLGLASLRFGPGEVELDTFGLVPEQVGNGLGAAFLTLVARLAWREAPTAHRFWLHTSSADHPNALRNYLRRGFRLYRTVSPTEREDTAAGATAAAPSGASS